MTEALDTTQDTLFGGRLRLLQPTHGLRVAIDGVLLAAALMPKGHASCLDLGCGTGVVGLCMASRLPELQVVGIDINTQNLALAIENGKINTLTDRMSWIAGQVPDVPLPSEVFDCVVCNPPYLEAKAHRASLSALRAQAMIEGPEGLESWVKTAIRACKQGGHVAFVHRSCRAADLLSAMKSGLGGLTLLTIHPHRGSDANRCLIVGCKGSHKPLRICPEFILHEKNGTWTQAAENILKGETLPPMWSK